MSLIHWWPLNGNLEDKGISNISLTNNGATINSSGKIGSCYSFNGNTLTSSSIEVGDEFSVCYWVKYNDLSYPRTHVGIQHSAGAYTGSNTGWDIGHGPSGGGTYNFDMNDGTHTQRMSFSITNITELNVWKHFTLTCSLSAKKVSVYVNGAFIESKDISSSMTSFKTNRALVIGGLYGWYLNGYLNDFRIYDHALSAKEVKEISKGLVLHYTFEDKESNLLTGNFSLNTGTTVDNTTHPFPGHGPIYKLSQSGNTSLVYRGLTETVSGVKPGDVISLSCWIYTENKASLDSGSELRCYQTKSNGGTTNWSGISWISSQVDGQWCYHSRQYTLDSDMASTVFNANVVKNGTYWITGIKVEYGSKATNWTGYKNSDNLVYDSSGYGYNGTVNGNLQISSDSMSGQYSSTYDGSSIYVEAPGPYLNGIDAYTFSIWCKPATTSLLGLFSLEYNTNWRASASTSGNLVRLRDNTGDSTYKEISMGSYTANEWALYTLTYNKGTAISYKNGTQVATVNVGGTALNTNQNWLSFGKNHQSSCWYNGKIGDIKIFATALSADDVKAEYNRKAAIDKNGNLFTGEIVETAANTSPKVDKNNFVSAKTISEGLMTKALDDGAVFERIYYFDYDQAGSVWNSTTAKSCNTAGKFSVLGSLNSYVPTDGWYEFYYRENNNWVRWKQSYNPLSKVTSGNSGSDSEYTYIGGSATPYSSFKGLTRYSSDDSSSCYLRGAPSWWCAIAPYQTSYDVFPDMWGNSSGNHHQELWIRVDNLKAAPEFRDTKYKLNKTGILVNSIEEL